MGDGMGTEFGWGKVVGAVPARVRRRLRGKEDEGGMHGWRVWDVFEWVEGG